MGESLLTGETGIGLDEFIWEREKSFTITGGI